MKEPHSKELFDIALCFAILLLAVLAGSAGCLAGGDETENAGNTTAEALADSGKNTLLAIYMVGSNLESEEEEGTANIMELVSGFSAQPEECFVVVGYGGAEKEGWRGMRIASIVELEQDAADGIIGNEELFREQFPDANMGDPETLARFLAYVNEIEGYEQRYLVFWDHGSGYQGYGHDEVWDDTLTLDEMKVAFSRNGERYDLIGFDACLMSMIEVAAVLEPYAKLLVASENLEPGSGWDYAPLARELSERPGMSPEAFGKLTVDSYMENPDDSQKTLALLDLGKTGALLAALDETGVVLREEIEAGNFEEVGQSFWYSQAFLYIPSERVQFSIDLTDFALHLRENIPTATTEADRLLGALDAFVLYSRHDEFLSRADGIAIASPRYITNDTLEEYRSAATVSPGWDAFFDSYVEMKSGDHENPVLTRNEDALTFSVSDNLGVAEVMLTYYIETEGEPMPIGEVPTLPDNEGHFGVEGWNGEWYCMQTGDGARVPILLSYEGRSGDSREIYYSLVEVTRNGTTARAVLQVYIDPVSHASEITVEPFEIDEDGAYTEAIGWTDDSLLPGDILTTYSLVYDESSDETTIIEIGTITVSPETRLSYGMMPPGAYSYGLCAEDFNDNISDPERVVIKIA
ncbi:MAG: clostripain-related cysteine peptidase [Methanoculleus sp.]